MLPNIKNTLLLLSAQAALVTGQCPNIYIFGARETGSTGFGSSNLFINMIREAYRGATAESIIYPACAGGKLCGSVAYPESIRWGTISVANQVNNYHQKCPNTRLILVGYGQGAHIMDNALCGGVDTLAGIHSRDVPILPSAVEMIKAAIFMSNHRARWGLEYQVGTCRSSGIDARPSSFACPSAAKIQSYCDARDKYCCISNGTYPLMTYTSVNGPEALAFIIRKLPFNDTTCAAKWEKCGGEVWTGPTCCEPGTTCQDVGNWNGKICMDAIQ